MEKNFRYMTVGLMLIVLAAYYGITTGNYIIGGLFTMLGFSLAYWAKKNAEHYS